jgi:hypothetical protein
MNLLRSICCLFSRGCSEEPEPTTGTRRNESPAAKADLGQKEADLEKTGKEQMGHMEGDEGQPANRQP